MYIVRRNRRSILRIACRDRAEDIQIWQYGNKCTVRGPGEIGDPRADASRTNSKSPALNRDLRDSLNESQRRVSPEKFTKRTEEHRLWREEWHKPEVLVSYEDQRGRELGSTQIWRRDNGPRETSSFPRIRRCCTAHSGAANALNNLPTAAAASAPGSNELGGAIILPLAPEVEPDADADADEADANEECVNDAKKRLVGVAAAVQDGSARAPAEPTLRESALWGAWEGAIIGWGWRVDARKCVRRELRRGGREDEANTHLDGTEAVQRRRSHCMTTHAAQTQEVDGVAGTAIRLRLLAVLPARMLDDFGAFGAAVGRARSDLAFFYINPGTRNTRRKKRKGNARVGVKSKCRNTSTDVRGRDRRRSNDSPSVSLSQIIRFLIAGHSAILNASLHRSSA
ncbi:hypothetical protein B0H13DRAFT_1900488 [Mycena leptocephala]|nr:hypothetical protein B0H13DRAFT_1900488 [Mycena leptocephala]